jgi:hypothetical protein
MRSPHFADDGARPTSRRFQRSHFAPQPRVRDAEARPRRHSTSSLSRRPKTLTLQSALTEFDRHGVLPPLGILLDGSSVRDPGPVRSHPKSGTGPGFWQYARSSASRRKCERDSAITRPMPRRLPRSDRTKISEIISWKSACGKGSDLLSHKRFRLKHRRCQTRC